MACNSLAELLEAVDNDSNPGPLDASQFMPIEEACHLA
jgi:hypothetical protein